jgi:outer membrane protein
LDFGKSRQAERLKLKSAPREKSWAPIFLFWPPIGKRARDHLMSRILTAAVGLLALVASSRALAGNDAGVPAQETLDATLSKAGEPNLVDGGVGGESVATPTIGAPSSSSDGGVPADAMPAVQALGLRDLQALAAQADPRAMIAYAQLEYAQGQQQEAKWIWFPDFATTAGFAGPTPEARLKGTTTEEGQPAPGPGGTGVDIFNVTDGTRKGLLGGEWGATARLNMSTQMPIYTFGKITAAQSAAAHGVEARRALLQGSKNQAAFDVARAYWSYQTTRDAQKSINETSDRINQARKQAADLIADKSDQVTQTDADRLDYIADVTAAQSDQAIANQRLSEAALKLLVGRMPEDPLVVVRETVPPPPAMPQMNAMLELARSNRPELKAALENVEARTALLELERAKYYPDFAIVGGIVYAVTTNADSPDSPFVYNPYNTFGGYVALGMKWTFDIPQKMARVKQVDAQLHEAIATQVGAERLVRLDIEQAMADLASARGRAEHYISGSARAKRLLVKGAVAFDSGLGQAFDLLIDTLLYSQAEGERLKALLDAQIAWAALERAVGVPIAQMPSPMPLPVLVAPRPAPIDAPVAAEPDAPAVPAKAIPTNAKTKKKAAAAPTR